MIRHAWVLKNSMDFTIGINFCKFFYKMLFVLCGGNLLRYDGAKSVLFRKKNSQHTLSICGSPMHIGINLPPESIREPIGSEELNFQQ